MTLQEWMDRRGLNDGKFVEKWPVVSRSQLSRIRRGECAATPETARALSEITKIPAAKFVMGEVAPR
jgi:antitoxin component HigA of HigAB toxin-antitoxin module